MKRKRLIDMCCKAGGASMGYYRAGFDVVGVDIEPQPNYPFEFIRANTFDLSADYLMQFDVIHASPPCQGYSKLKHRTGKSYPLLISEIRSLLQSSGKFYVIENVVGAPLVNPFTLCGTQFGLGVIRHRLFETNFDIGLIPPCNHYDQVRGSRGKKTTGGFHAVYGNLKYSTLDEWKKAMGIDWMTREELSQAIPPAYTEWIGKRLLEL